MRLPILSPLLIPLAILAACASHPTISPSSTVAAPLPPPSCPAPALAPLTAEPLPPAGISASALHSWLSLMYGTAGEAFFEWLAIDHPTWARELARRLESTQAECKKAPSP